MKLRKLYQGHKFDWFPYKNIYVETFYIIPEDTHSTYSG